MGHPALPSPPFLLYLAALLQDAHLLWARYLRRPEPHALSPDWTMPVRWLIPFACDCFQEKHVQLFCPMRHEETRAGDSWGCRGTRWWEGGGLSE